VLCISARSGEGLDELWQVIERHRTIFTRTSAFEQRRRQQRVAWFRSALEERLERLLREDPVIAARLREMEWAVAAGQFAPEAAAWHVVEELQARLARKRSGVGAHGG
jgi:LAO/AO transport system kinase